jgi:molecular chaperone IbpA
MRNLDLTPLFRASVGFDNLTRVLDAAARQDGAQVSYPPYNIAKASDDDYRITFAVAGFAQDDIDVVIENNTLTVKGKVEQDNEGIAYLHRGIAGRSFERRFQLADHIQVKNASLENGLLHVDLKREVPEALKPRVISVTTTQSPKQIEGATEKKAA